MSFNNTITSLTYAIQSRELGQSKVDQMKTDLEKKKDLKPMDRFLEEQKIRQEQTKVNIQTTKNTTYVQKSIQLDQQRMAMNSLMSNMGRFKF